MSKAVDQLEKLADKFENKLSRRAQAAPMESPPVEISAAYLDELLNKLFSTNDKNKIMTDIYNGTDVEDVKTITTNPGIKNKVPYGNVFINESKTPDPKGSAILASALKAKIQEPNLTKYDGTFVNNWIHYPK